MKSALAFIKTHGISLGSGMAALIFIALAVVFMSSNAVTARMTKVISETGAGSIQGLMNNPKNQEIIDRELEKGAAFEREFGLTLEEAKRINRREPLMEGAFPKPVDASTPYRFVELYKERFAALDKPLEPGTPPTPLDLQEAQSNIEDEINAAREAADESAVEKSPGRPGDPRTPPAPPPPPPAPAGRFITEEPAFRRGGFQSEGMMPPGGGMPSGGASVEPKYNPFIRARVEKARSIKVYVDPFALHQSPIALSSSPPTPTEMWFAQMGLWVQSDVIRAIQELNDAAAQRAAQADSSVDPNVEHVPVKRLISLRVLGYEAGRKIEFPAASGALEAREPVRSFTQSKCNEQFDVVQFTMTVVIDQREIPRLIDQIGKTNFYRCIDLDYDNVHRDSDLAQGYEYGTAPVVRVTLTFEGFFARELYKDLMPAEVADLIAGKQGDGHAP